MEGRKRTTTFVVARFLDALCGPPTFWVPLEFFLPLSVRRGKKSRPTSLQRGEGHGLRGRGALLVMGGKNEVRSTVDAVDLELKLRSDLQ